MFCRVPGGTFKMWYLWPLPEDIIRRWFQCRDSCNPSLSYLLVQVELSSDFLAASPLLSFQIFIYLCVCVCNCVCRPKTDARMSSLLCLFIFLLQNLDLLILIRLAGQSTQDPSASTYHHWANKHFFLCLAFKRTWVLVMTAGVLNSVVSAASSAPSSSPSTSFPFSSSCI